MNQLTELLDLLTQTLPPNLYSFHQPVSLEEIQLLCENHHFGFSFIDGQHIKNKSDFLDCCSVKMDFPDYFGKNWDAFEDCLTDKLLSCQQPYLIFYTQANKLAQNNPQDWEKLLDIFQSSIEFLQTKNINLYVVLHRAISF